MNGRFGDFALRMPRAAAPAVCVNAHPIVFTALHQSNTPNTGWYWGYIICFDSGFLPVFPGIFLSQKLFRSFGAALKPRLCLGLCAALCQDVYLYLRLGPRRTDYHAAAVRKFKGENV